MEKSGDLLKISQTDTTAFEVGRNLAVTPGKVVFQNDLLQLIQYTPTTEKVHEVPLLIVPPWINKFYILDLDAAEVLHQVRRRPGLHGVRRLLGQPGRAPRAQDVRGLHEARASSPPPMRCSARPAQKQINVVGYCVGGTLLATTLAYLAARGRRPLSRRRRSSPPRSTSPRPATCCCSSTTRSCKALEEMMAERGYLDGSRMATVFNMLRPADLIWPYIVNNYMLGKKPFPFDLLYWNQDSTRMPAANHNFYLREFYHENKLAKGEMTIGGVTLDLEQGEAADLRAGGTRGPHRAGQVGVHRLAAVRRPGRVRAGGLGPHRRRHQSAGEASAKYQYLDQLRDRVDTLEEWLEGAEETPGSWWPHWIEWLAKQSGGMIAARDARRQARRHRGRARQLRQGQELSFFTPRRQ